jgi:uncharacterized protein YkwD
MHKTFLAVFSLFPLIIAHPASAMMPASFDVELHEQKQAMTRIERMRDNRLQERLKKVENETQEKTVAVYQVSRRLIRSAASSASSALTLRNHAPSRRSSSSRSSSSAQSSSSISRVSSSSSSSPSLSSSSVQGTALQQEVLKLTNAERSDEGLRGFTLNADLNESAQAYAREMAMTGLFSHTDSNGDSSYERIQETGYLDPPCDCASGYYTGENLAKNIDTAAGAVTAWMNSPSHRDNMLHPHFTEIGVGIFDGYWVIHFGHLQINN